MAAEAHACDDRLVYCVIRKRNTYHLRTISERHIVCVTVKCKQLVLPCDAGICSHYYNTCRQLTTDITEVTWHREIAQFAA